MAQKENHQPYIKGSPGDPDNSVLGYVKSNSFSIFEHNHLEDATKRKIPYFQ